jgi:hypothetical protein
MCSTKFDLLPRSGVPPSFFGHRNFSYFALRNSAQKKEAFKKIADAFGVGIDDLMKE